TDAERHAARRGLSPGATQRHAGLARRRRLSQLAQGRSGGVKIAQRRRARGPVRPRLSHQARRYHFRPRVRRGGRRRYQPSTRRARKMTTIEPIRAVTMLSTQALPRLRFQPAELKIKEPTKAPMMPVIR